MNLVLDLGQTPFLGDRESEPGRDVRVHRHLDRRHAGIRRRHSPIDYNSNTDTIDDIRNDMVLAINGGTVITGFNATNVPHLAGLNGETFQVADNTGKQYTFQFIDSSGTTVPSTSDIEISYNSAADTIADVSDDVLAAINASGLAVTATSVSSGIALAGTDVAFAAGTTPFQSTVVAGLSFGVTAQARPDGETFITGVDSAHILNLATLDGETFEIADSKGNQVSFQFIDSSGTIALVPGNVEISYDSATDTIAKVIADMVTAINAVGLDVVASAQPSGVALSGPKIVFSAGTTPFQSTDNGTIALYGYKITFSPVGSMSGAKESPFLQYGRTSGSYQLQIRLQVNMDIPGSEVQYASIRYATDGVDIQGMPDSSPLVTSVNSLGTNTSFATAQDIGNVLDTSNNEISVSGQLTGQDDVNWYKFELSYTDIQDYQTQTDSFPLSLSVNYADGLGRPDTVLWVFDSAGDLIYEANNSDVVEQPELSWKRRHRSERHVLRTRRPSPGAGPIPGIRDGDLLCRDHGHRNDGRRLATGPDSPGTDRFDQPRRRGPHRVLRWFGDCRPVDRLDSQPVYAGRRHDVYHYGQQSRHREPVDGRL